MIRESINWDNAYIALIIIILIFVAWIVYAYRDPIEGFVSSYYVRNNSAQAFDGNWSETSPFINWNLTQKPRFNNAPFTNTEWWKKDFNPSLNRQYRNCDQYRCQTLKQNGYDAKSHFNLQNGVYVDPTQHSLDISKDNFNPTNFTYFENPLEYCAQNPNFTACPNNWTDHSK
jgi:hypothetical protein